jgi:hypothetical protein
VPLKDSACQVKQCLTEGLQIRWSIQVEEQEARDDINVDMELQRAQAFAGDTSVRQPKERIAVTMPLLLQLRSRTQLPKGMHSRRILIHLAKRPSSTLCKRSLQMRPSSKCCWRIRHIYFCATSSLAVEVQWNYLPHYKRRAPSRAMLSPGVPAKPRIPPPLPPLMASEACGHTLCSVRDSRVPREEVKLYQ